MEVPFILVNFWGQVALIGALGALAFIMGMGGRL
jgi:hypothetical protein